LDPQAQVTLVDVAEKMLAIARRHMEFENIDDIEVIAADALGFLQEARQFDLIIFSSAVHHFKDPVNLLYTAAQKLSAHGFIVTLADPTTMIKTKKYNMFNFLITGWDNKKRMARQYWEKCISSRNSEAAACREADFDVAEFQTYLGIDDFQLKQNLARVGVKSLVHMRYPAGGGPLITRIMGMVGICWAYGLILYRDSDQNYQQLEREIKAAIKQQLPFKTKYL
jgi:SAM-dependent methyltransferase